MVDDSAVLRARDTAVVHAGRVFALTSKGVVAISEAGVEIVSEAIRKDLEPYVKNMFLGPAFAVSVEADHRIEFWLPSESSADIGQCVAAYVYNSKHGEWFVSTDDNGFRHGVGATPAVSELLNKSSSRALYAEHATSNRVVQERLPGDSSAEELDHLAGRASSYTATAVSSATVTVASTTGIEVGDGIIQTVSGDARRCIVTAVLSSTQFTVDVSGYVAVASFVAVKPVDVSLRISEIDNRAPNQRKRIRDAVLHFRDAVVRQFGYLTMKNDVGNVEKHEIFRTPNWGSEEWGASPFGDPEPFRRRVRKGVPLAASDGVSIRIGLDVSEAFAWFELIGASLEGEPVSERTGR
jgi:hypothetical protein